MLRKQQYNRNKERKQIRCRRCIEKTVSVRGGILFQVNCIVIGWKGSACSFSENTASQITRNDWIVKWDEQCVYVTGGLPEFIKLFDNSYYGREAVLKAVIRLDKEGKVYLEYIKCNELVSK